MRLFTPRDGGVCDKFEAEFYSGGDTVIDIFGAPRLLAYIDGEYLTEGPYRFAAVPECERIHIKLKEGKHTVVAFVAGDDSDTRIYKACPSCFALSVNGEEIVPRVSKLNGALRLRRINPQLGYAEFRDLRVPDGEWQEPKECDFFGGEIKPTDIGRIRSFDKPAVLMGSGEYSEVFGYCDDDPPARFMLRKLIKDEPPYGTWLRYDLGKIGLFRIDAVISAPAGTVAEFAYGEYLHDGRVLPYINLSAGQSCNLDRFVLCGGENRVFNLTPRGGRYVEIHIGAPACDVEVKSVRFIGREYFGEPKGSFNCADELINKIWLTGIDTLRACSEDTIIDNPTRERGEWTGDVVSAGLELSATGYADLSLIKRGLTHAALCASRDGCVAGLAPGGVGHLSTYALMWVNACMNYYGNTGDLKLLRELFGYAQKNLSYFMAKSGEKGLDNSVYWAFVDWGYVPNSEHDISLNIFYYSALREMINWCALLGKDAGEYEKERDKISAVIVKYVNSLPEDLGGMGMHRAVLALKEGFLSGERKKAAAKLIKSHYLGCFPCDKNAPRQGFPDNACDRLITPYFSHFALSELWKAGEGDFVLKIYRDCWGWMLSRASTWLEVFDTHWSHCHQWSGCPTWQLSRFVLGLKPRFDLGKYTYEFSGEKCSIENASGDIPIFGGGVIRAKRSGDKFTFMPDRDITVYYGGKPVKAKKGDELSLEI